MLAARGLRLTQAVAALLACAAAVFHWVSSDVYERNIRLNASTSHVCVICAVSGFNRTVSQTRSYGVSVVLVPQCQQRALRHQRNSWENCDLNGSASIETVHRVTMKSALFVYLFCVGFVSR